jgi:Zn-dependent oligopeptidase
MLMTQVLALRQEKAELLGFSSFAEVSMASKVGMDGGHAEANIPCACA